MAKPLGETVSTENWKKDPVERKRPSPRFNKPRNGVPRQFPPLEGVLLLDQIFRLFGEKFAGLTSDGDFIFVNRSRDALNLEYAERARSRAALECILQNATRVKRCRARFVCTCNTHVVLELPSGWERWVSNGKIPSVLLFRSLCSRNRQESCSNFIVKSSPLEGRRRRKKGWRQFTFVE